jgi:hypothetical protein
MTSEPDDQTLFGGRHAPPASVMPEDRLRALLGSGRPVSSAEMDEAQRRWRSLKSENAPFRIVSESGLISAPIDCFDPMLLERSTAEWSRATRIVGEAMGHNSDSYYQVGDLMLLTRIVALVEQGKLLADGDPWDMRNCRLRLPD